MRVKTTLDLILLVFFTIILNFKAHAFESFYCPKGDDLFLKDRQVADCNEDRKPTRLTSQHVHLFDIRKSYNSENVLVIFTKTTDDCKFAPAQNPQDLVDLYWRMNEGKQDVCRKESAVKERIRQKLKIHSLSPDRTQMTVTLEDLDKVRHDLPERAATVTLRKNATTKICETNIQFNLSVADTAKKLNLSCVYGEPVMWLGIPAPIEEVEALTLVGLDENGNPIRKRFRR